MNDLDIKDIVSSLVYQIADEVDWLHLAITERQAYYEKWTIDPRIGGQLREVMSPSRVRVYLKDSVMKSYSRSRRPKLRRLLARMSISFGQVTQEFIKPEALLCDGQDLYTLAVAKEWRVAITSAFERGWEVRHLGKNVIFIIEHTTGRFVDKAYREMINSVGARLGVAIHWVT